MKARDVIFGELESHSVYQATDQRVKRFRRRSSAQLGLLLMNDSPCDGNRPSRAVFLSTCSGYKHVDVPAIERELQEVAKAGFLSSNKILCWTKVHGQYSISGLLEHRIITISTDSNYPKWLLL